MYSRFIREKRITSRHETAVYNKFRRINWSLFLLVTILSCVGFAMLYSAANGSFEPWAGRQLLRFLIMLPVMFIIAVVDVKVWYRYSYFIYFLGITLLIFVFAVGFLGKGAQRWINLGPVNLQPSELMKIFLILALARYFHAMHHSETDRIFRLVMPLMLIFVPFVMVLKQPNLGTATIIFGTGIAMFFITGVGWKKFVFSGLLVLSLIPLAWNHLHDYQKRRVITFINPDADPLGAGYNIIQSKIAIGSGGFNGKGFQEGSQGQLNFLPEKQTDFIFTMLAEEFGFIGGVTVLLLFFALIVSTLKVALDCENHFARMVCAGVAAMLFIHLFINVAMVMGMIPVVGVPLPLLSYGGSSMVSILMCFGFVLNAHVHKDSNLY